MISRYEVTIGGHKLSRVHKDLLILDVSYDPPEIGYTIATVAMRDGVTITRQYKGKVTCTVTFELHIYGIEERQTALQDVMTWAQGSGALRTNDRPEQRLENFVIESYPSISSVRNWTDPLTITFAAYNWPYWVDEEETTLKVSGKTGKGTLKVPGNAGMNGNTLVEVDVTANAALSKITLTVGSTSIALEEISVPKNGVIKIAYNSQKVLSIKYGSKSLLANRTAKSSDDLLAACGKSTNVSISASTSVSAVFRARGCWH